MRGNCKYCGERVTTVEHNCSVVDRVLNRVTEPDFLISAGVAAITDNFLIGGIVGGDFGGSILGDLLGDGELF